MSELSIKRNFVLSILYQILTMLTPFITAPYISRVLGADGVGIYSYTGSIQYYFSMFAALGTVSYGTREIARVRNNKEQRSKLFWEIETITIITTLLSLIIWFAIILFQNNYQMYFLACTFNIVAVLFDISWLYAGLEHFEYTVLQNSILKILGIVAIFLFVQKKEDLIFYILIIALTTCIGNLSMWIYLPKCVEKVDIRTLTIKRHFKETFVYFIPTIATSIYTVLDKTLIGVFTNDNYQNGYYEQATKIINMAKSVCFVALNNVLGSRISFLFAENKLDEVREKIDISINYILFMGIGIVFGLMGIASRFVPWFFGNGYESVVYLLWILSPISLIIGISNCLGSQYYTPAGLRNLSVKYLIVGSCVNLILNCILIPRLMSYGAAIATVIAEIVITVLYMWNCDGYLTVKQIFKHGWKKIIAGACMFGWLIILDKIIDSNLLMIVMGGITGSLIYILLLTVMKDSFVKIGRNMITSKIRKR